MTRYVLDTQLYIEAIRDAEKAAALGEFTATFLPRIVLHAVVAQELLAGAITPGARRAVDRNLIRPFERRGRVLTPTYAAWRRSGEIIAALVAKGELTAGGIPPSFTNDAVIAASCREHGLTLITRNRRDFDRIARVERFPRVEPWPDVQV